MSVLLFRIDEVLSVTSYDGSRVYEEGIDYAVDDGKSIALEGGSIPASRAGSTEPTRFAAGHKA